MTDEIINNHERQVNHRRYLLGRKKYRFIKHGADPYAPRYSKYMPHQGVKEMARRVRAMQKHDTL